MAMALRSSDFCDLWYMVTRVWSCFVHIKVVPESRSTRKRQKIWATKSVRARYGCMAFNMFALLISVIGCHLLLCHILPLCWLNTTEK